MDVNKESAIKPTTDVWTCGFQWTWTFETIIHNAKKHCDYTILKITNKMKRPPHLNSTFPFCWEKEHNHMIVPK